MQADVPPPPAIVHDFAHYKDGVEFISRCETGARVNLYINDRADSRVEAIIVGRTVYAGADLAQVNRILSTRREIASIEAACISDQNVRLTVHWRRLSSDSLGAGMVVDVVNHQVRVRSSD